MTGAVAAWLMVTPVVTFTGWLLVRLLGDPGGSNPLLELVLSSRDPIALGLMAFTAVVLAPLFEEVIFRGALLPVLTESVGVFWGVVLSGLTFGLAHISIGELAPLTVLGIGLALMRLSSGRLLPCVLMHALWNAVTFFNLLLL
jgi:membrane protease YdiL (CAAX protease family)